MKNCLQCQLPFEIAPEDKTFYDKVSPIIAGKKYSIPELTLCPSCRRQRRLAWRNEIIIYRRKCDKTGEKVFSIYPEKSPFPVYSPKAWFGDDWDPTDYGQDFDFNRPFFEQFYELQGKVPRISNILEKTENCEYCNAVADSKNCYLIYGSVNCEDCMYGSPHHCKNCIDSLILRKSEWCYECVDSSYLYECRHCQNCKNSQNLEFCFDLEGCKNCFLCAGLRYKEHYILNEAYSKEDYDKKVSELKVEGPDKLMKKLQDLKKSVPVKFMTGINNENVTGDHVLNCKNANNIFYGDTCENVNYCNQMFKSNNCIDCDVVDYCDFIYEISGSYKASNIKFCHWCWEVSDLFYCSICTMNTANCFGCISLRHKKYCILNKQYTKEEYEVLVPKIIEYMKKTGEWGEFFPIQFSPFAYNETVAQYYFPLNKNDVLKNGWNFKDDIDVKPQASKVISANKLPVDINKILDDILNWAIECEATKRLFKITPKELKFYRKFNLPVPRLHPQERHLRRIKMRNPMKLWDRKCDKCLSAIQTTYSPERPEKVYCENCYLKEVY